MNQITEDVRWIQRGSQRATVAQVLKKPMTGKEICVAAQALNPRIQLRDVWFLMKQFDQRGLALCLNSRQTTGRLYCLTDYGGQVVANSFGIVIKPVAQGVNWKKYSLVIRGKIRRMTLLTIARITSKKRKTVTEVRKALREEYPVGLNPVIRAVKDLLDLGLVKASDQTHGSRRMYRVTAAGQRIVTQLLA